MSSRRLGVYLAMALTAQLTAAQTVVNSIFTPHGAGYYGDPANWSPPEVPNNSPEKNYNVTIPGFVRMNVDATISNLALTGYYFVDDRSLTVIGATTPTDFTIYIASNSPSEALFSAGSLGSFSAGSLAGTYYLTNYNTTAGWATLQFNGAHVTTLSKAQLSLAGPMTRIVDEFGNDALRDLAHIESDSGLQIGGRQLAITSPFTNDGQLTISGGLFSIPGTLTNFNAASRTLTGGTYQIWSVPNQPSVFQFAGADIVHNAASLEISGPLAKILDQNGNDALRNFVHNTPAGAFRVLGIDFTIGGNFTNDGVLSIGAGTLTVAGSLTNFDPATRTLTGGTYQADGSSGIASFVFGGVDIVNNAASINLLNGGSISDENGNNALRNFAHNLRGAEFTLRDYYGFTAPSDFTNAGVVNIFGDPPTNTSQAHFSLTEGHSYQQTEGATYLRYARFTGDMAINGGSFTTAGTNAFFAPPSEVNGDLFIGDAFFGPLFLTVHGAVHLSPSSRFLTSPDDYAGVFRVDGTFTAGGTLQINSEQFPPPSTETYPVVLTNGGVIDTFSNAPNGARIPTTNGLGSFIVSYSPFDIWISDFQAIPPATQLLNISTRAQVLTGNNVVIGGFVVFGHDPKTVIVRGIGPSLTSSGIAGALQDPMLELHGPGGATIATNDNWRDTQEAEIEASGLAPSDDRESAIIATLAPGAYTSVLTGKNSTIGVALVEVYDLASETYSRVANISTRGFVDPENVLIGGFIAGGSGPGNAELVLRGIGPLLSRTGLTGFLPDPTLELRDGQGSLLAYNDDFNDSPENFKRIDPSLQMFNAKDSALPATLPPGNYTAIVRGKGGATGVALVEVYDMNR